MQKIKFICGLFKLLKLFSAITSSPIHLCGEYFTKFSEGTNWVFPDLFFQTKFEFILEIMQKFFVWDRPFQQVDLIEQKTKLGISAFVCTKKLERNLKTCTFSLICENVLKLFENISIFHPQNHEGSFICGKIWSFRFAWFSC